jgi:hypothetical protein
MIGKITKFFSVIIFLISISNYVFADTTKKQHIIFDCTIFDLKGKALWSFNYSNCLFFKNGDFAAANTDELVYFNSKMHQLWRKELNIHHGMRKSFDNKSILTMSSSPSSYNGGLTRFDSILIVSRKGKIEKEFSYDKNLVKLRKSLGLKKINKNNNMPPLLFKKKNLTAEISHLNSMYEIPKNKAAEKNSAFKSGNYIFNDLGFERIFIFDSNLKKVLWSISYEDIRGSPSNIHDVSVTSDGKILLFVNQSNASKTSEVLLLDPITFEEKVIYKPSDNYSVYKRGTVNIFSGGNELLLSVKNHESEKTKVDPTKDYFPLARIVSLSDMKHRFWPSKENFENTHRRFFKDRFVPFIYLDDATEFLSKNKGL